MEAVWRMGRGGACCQAEAGIKLSRLARNRGGLTDDDPAPFTGAPGACPSQVESLGD